MKRVNQIIQHPLYRECYDKIVRWEKERVFCHHDHRHFLDVCRIAMILSERQSLPLEKELIYATGLLHDIGRFEQYEVGTPHEIASAKIAPLILQDCGFQDEEIQEIVLAIRQHRNAAIQEEASLCGIIYRADKLSRDCYFCAVEAQCNWKNEKKNKDLLW